MKKRRSKNEILIQILQVIKDGNSKPTRIMYAANTAWKPVVQYLDELWTKGLIEMGPKPEKDKRSSKTYYLTDQGQEAIKQFNKAMRLLKFDNT